MAIPNRIARLNSDGTTNTSFSPGAGLDAEGFCINLDAAGRVVAGGSFNMVGDFLRPKLAFFEADGELIGSTPTPSASVRTLATQTSGEILLGGDFITINGITRNRIARILPDLSLEAGFNPNASAPVYAIALQTDGEILVGGNFTGVGAIDRKYVARLYNGIAADRLYANSASLIRWDRTGTNEVTQRVTFEIDTGSGYEPLAGTISQVATGWQIIPSTPLSGTTNNVRATAFPSDSHSSGTHQIVASLPISPEIEVRINNELMVSGDSTVFFPRLQVGTTATATVVITNLGLATLTLTSAVTITGQWEIVSQPAITSIAPQTSVPFNILFRPASEGLKNGTLSIFSDDPNYSEATPFTVELSGEATAGPGGQDLEWQPGANDQVRALAKSSDNSVWLGGIFTTVLAASRPRLALTYVDAQGKLRLKVQAANVIPNGVTINCIAQLPDGTALVGGSNTSKLYWVGFAPTGEVILKNSFSIVTFAGYPAGATIVNCMAVQEDGFVLVGGFFEGITIGGFTGKGSLIRIKFLPDSKGVMVASIDTSFFSAVLVGQDILTMALQTDGKIALCSRGSIQTAIRISSEGVLDTTFSSIVRFAEFVAIDSQGRFLVGGRPLYINETRVDGVVRLSSSGALDPTFESVDLLMFGLLPMVDGTAVFAGSGFPCLAKFLTDGTVDTSFVSNLRGTVMTMCSQEDGALLIGGSFSNTNGAFTSARIINSPASTALTVVDATQVQWLRSGAIPETQVVVFDVSQDNGTTWIRFGQGQRITGGWQLTGINLPFSGILRARAYIQSAGNSSIMEDQISFSGLDVADLIVQVPGKTIVADGGTANPVKSQAGNVLAVPVTLVNTGRAELSGVVATVTTTPIAGTGRWTIFADPNGTIPAGGNSTMIVNFYPENGDRGELFAELSIKSSVPGLKNPYTVKLVGAAVTQPIAEIRSATVIPGPAGAVDFEGFFTPNDYNASAYFRYGPLDASESTWLSTPVTILSGFGTAQKLIKQVFALALGVPYGVRAYMTNSINVTSPAVSKNREDFTPTL
jgi:hypothetical protein